MVSKFYCQFPGRHVILTCFYGFSHNVDSSMDTSLHTWCPFRQILLYIGRLFLQRKVQKTIIVNFIKLVHTGFIFQSNGFFWLVFWIVLRWELKEVLLFCPLHIQLFVMFSLRFLVVDIICSSSSSNNSSSNCSSNNGSPRETIMILLWNGT